MILKFYAHKIDARTNTTTLIDNKANIIHFLWKTALEVYFSFFLSTYIINEKCALGFRNENLLCQKMRAVLYSPFCSIWCSSGSRPFDPIPRPRRVQLCAAFRQKCNVFIHTRMYKTFNNISYTISTANGSSCGTSRQSKIMQSRWYNTGQTTSDVSREVLDLSHLFFVQSNLKFYIVIKTQSLFLLREQYLCEIMIGLKIFCNILYSVLLTSPN